MGFDLYEMLIERQPLSEVLKFAAGRMQNDAVDTVDQPTSSAPTDPVPYSPYERGTKSIPIEFEATT